MIETYKIITGKYQGCVAPSLTTEEVYITRGSEEMISDFRSYGLDMIYANLAFSNQIKSNQVYFRQHGP